MMDNDIEMKRLQCEAEATTEGERVRNLKVLMQKSMLQSRMSDRGHGGGMLIARDPEGRSEGKRALR